MLSLIHMLAARACHADTLKRALTGDDDARRLLSLLGVTPLDLQAIDHGRITRRKAALNEQEGSTADAIDLALMWMSTTPPDALSKMDAHYKALLKQGTASINELRQRLQAEIMAHDTTRSQVGKAPKPEQTPPEEVIVLGPWQKNTRGMMHWFRRRVGDHSNDLPDSLVQCVGWRVGAKTGDETDEDGKDAADDWARKTYALIDAEPDSVVGVLGAWDDHWVAKRCDMQQATIGTFVEVAPREWNIWRRRPGGTYERLAHGPQTGEEGKRYALAAAHALGLTGGDE